VAILTTLLLGVFAPSALAAPEEPVAEAATGVSATSATLHGELNPGGSAEELTYHFAYNQGPACEGFSAPEFPEPASGPNQKVSATATGLIPSSEYTFCLLASNLAEETSSSAPLSFTTAAQAPAIDFSSASAVTPRTATLEALVNPNNQPSTACHFEYGTATVSENSAPCEPASLEGFGDQFVTAAVSALEPSNTYHFRLVVENATGTTEGSEGEFSTPTPEVPNVVSESFSALTSSSATLEAVINPNWEETTYVFQYATDEAMTSPVEVPGASPLPGVFEEQPVSAPIAGLAPDTTYFYRVLATNALGTTEGPVQSLSTTSVPAIVPASVQGITRTSARLTGASIDPASLATTYSLRYIDQAGYEAGLAATPSDPYAKGARSIPPGSLEAIHGPQAISPITIGELTPGTTYHYALVASNSLGTVASADHSFTTLPPTPPSATTGAAEAVSQTSATITGTADTHELPSTIQFEFGTTPGAGSLTSATTSAGSGSLTNASASFANSLQPATTYYYRLIVTNADGTAYGEQRSFTTGSFGPSGAPGAVSLVAYPAFVLKELAAGQGPQIGSAPPKPALTKKQKLARALKACGKKPKRKRAGCRRAARKRYR
jgi:hypothetical protein